MAWTIAIIISLVSLAAILLFLNKSFEKSKQGIKMFLTLCCFAVMIIIAQVIKLIIQDKASSSIINSLNLLSTANLVVTIVMFSFFLLYFFITYMVGVLNGIKGKKQDEKEGTYDD